LFSSTAINITAGAVSKIGGKVVYESSGGTGPESIVARKYLLLPYTSATYKSTG
jgi:hypothetical protein